MARKTYRRARWLIDSEIQIGLGLRLALCMAGYLALFLVVALVDPIIVLLSGSVSEGARQAAMHDATGFLRSTIGPLLFATACMILHAIIILHRIAGPVLRFRKSFDNIARGDLSSPVNLRHGDMLESLAEDHNLCLAVLREDLRQVRTEVENLKDASRDDSVLPEVRRRKIEAGLERLDTVVGHWRIDGVSTDRAGSPRPRREPADA